MDGFIAYITSHYAWFWTLLSKIPFFNKHLNRFAINSIVKSTNPRPHLYSLWSPEPIADPEKLLSYTSWCSLTDRRYTSRQLPPVEQAPSLPELDKVKELYRRDMPNKKSERSTLMFALFAQWFTDSFLRTDADDFRKNTSNHEIDLCQIYGLKESTTNILRQKSLGKLKSQMINGEEYPPFLFAEDGQVKEEFAGLPYINQLPAIYSALGLDSEERKHIFVSGLERGNTTIGYSALNTVFLREHNSVCDKLHQAYPDWDDERLFQTARNILIVILLKIVVEDYVNHISPAYFPFHVETGFAESQPWYRTNWITAEFDLLYRWHSLMPDKIKLDGIDLSPTQFMLNNKPLTELGLGKVINDLSSQAAYKPGLFNSPDFLLGAEKGSIEQGRQSGLRTYNDYREAYNKKRLTDFSQLTSDTHLQKRLQELYGTVDKVEFWVGIFAEEPGNRALFGELLTLMVGADAFSQALTNPLLSKYVFNKNTFSEVGMKIIEASSTLEDVVRRNIDSSQQTRVSFDL